jgi:hypothetical protein
MAKGHNQNGATNKPDAPFEREELDAISLTAHDLAASWCAPNSPSASHRQGAG